MRIMTLLKAYLFNTDNQVTNSDDLLSSSDEMEEDDLEIPAFLRRQKN